MRQTILAAALSLFAAHSVRAQDDVAASARLKAGDAKVRCATLLHDVDGVTGVNFGGSGAEFRLLIVVRDYPAREAARDKTGGDRWEGLPIVWSVTSPAPAQPVTAVSAAEPAPRVEKRTLAVANGPDCDIDRCRLGFPALRRPVGGVSPKSWVPCQVRLRSVIGGGGGHSYLYTKHRPGCGTRDGLASHVVREGFLYPTELRGSDSNWAAQVHQDLDHKFPPPSPPMQPKTVPYRRDVPTGDSR